MLDILFKSDGSPRDTFIELAGYLFALIVGFMMHELAHGYVAKWNGDDTAKLAGRLTFNPLKHLDLLGTVCLLLFGFGWAKPVPINTRNFRHFRRGFFAVAIAGVTMNLILALFFTGAYHLRSFAEPALTATELGATIAYLLYAFTYYSIFVNLMLMIFNLMPVAPLDGFRVLEALGEGKSRIIDKYIDFMRRYGFMTIIIIIAFNNLGLFSAIIGWFADILGIK
ncbi:MAG: site-2 protease family protein [Clostridiales bacterium]|jgi:Zn-dependent protease|nr:site-2 protease family protein [Clostridiales bacterium]